LRNLLRVFITMVSVLVFTTQVGVRTAQCATDKTIGASARPGSGEEEGSPAAGAKPDVQEELGKILPYWTMGPFIIILLAIALLPLIHGH